MQRALTFATVALCGSVAAFTVLAQESAAPAPDEAASPAEAFIGQLDSNDDGAVTLDEALAPQKEQFKEIDADGSGTLDAAEASAAFEAKVPEEMLEEMKKRGMPNPGESFIENLDKNGDGVVDVEEFEAPTGESFARMDADGDGKATVEEATAYFEDIQRRMQERIEQMQQMQEQPQQ
jgi:Ca2+-binding EF-hand superfamily protein